MKTPPSKKTSPLLDPPRSAANQKFKRPRITVPLFCLPVTALVAVAASYFLFGNGAFPGRSLRRDAATNVTAPDQSETLEHVRLSGYRFIKPLLITDVDREDESLEPLKRKLEDYVAGRRAAGDATSVSVYVRKLQNGEWTGVNPLETYQPASMLKLPVLITILKMSESDSSSLDIRIRNTVKPETVKGQTFSDSTITYGKEYTIRHLLEMMVIHSDNAATMLLERLLTGPLFDKIFVDLQLTAPPHQDLSYALTARDYARFMRVLYNATYLNRRNSEYALQLLSRATFDKGLRGGLPKNITVAHKFGESYAGSEKMLHECGIVYTDDPYLITVMTKGTDVNKLADVVAGASRVTYEFFAKPQAPL